MHLQNKYLSLKALSASGTFISFSAEQINTLEEGVYSVCSFELSYVLILKVEHERYCTMCGSHHFRLNVFLHYLNLQMKYFWLY